jgi:hypothetical protein
MYEKGSLPDAWLLDAPLFIDDEQVKSLYNAVALPEYEEEYLTVETKALKISKWSAGAEVGAEAGTGAIISHLLGAIKIKTKMKGELGGQTEEGSDDTIKLTAVKSPERRLLNLAVHYAVNISGQLWNVKGLDDFSWIEQASAVADAPRPLVFLDVVQDAQQESKRFPIVPMAAELSNGKVVTFYDRIPAAVKGPGEIIPPKYPPSDIGDEANEFWTWMREARPGKADTSILLMNMVEEAIGAGGRPRWMDCRVPLGPPGEQTQSLHLHIKGREAYDTGDFAYHLLHRGKLHGFRVVGTLKTGPALNVLALYEK